MARNVILQKGCNLEKVKVTFKVNGTTTILDLKNIDPDTKINILRALVQKLWSKTSICIMGAFAYITRSNHSKYYFVY